MRDRLILSVGAVVTVVLFAIGSGASAGAAGPARVGDPGAVLPGITPCVIPLDVPAPCDPPSKPKRPPEDICVNCPTPTPTPRVRLHTGPAFRVVCETNPAPLQPRVCPTPTLPTIEP